MSIKSKVGAVIKILANFYWDKKFSDTGSLKKELPAMHDWSTKVQSIDYLYLMASLKMFDISPMDKVLDLGSGKGRALLYCNYKYNLVKKMGVHFYGAEINKEAYLTCKKICANKQFIQTENVNALEKKFINKNEINKILLFNPFDERAFKEFIEVIKNEIKYPVSFLYMNVSQKHISVLKNKKIPFEVHCINEPFLGIWDKKNVVVHSKGEEYAR